MANIIWTFVVMFVIHDAQSSLPLLEEVKNRTRWCLGEGSHCPVNLLYSFPSCCKPYVCMEVPKTCKPAFILKFTHYTDHRCMLPSSNLTKVDQEPIFHENVSETESLLPTNENVISKIIPEYNSTCEITTLQFDTNETFVNVSNSGEYEDSYENAASASNETYLESNETLHSHIFKKRSITHISSEHNVKSRSDDSYTSVEAGDYNETYSLESENSSFENSNITSSSESEKSVTNSKTSKVVDSSEYLSVNDTLVKNDSLLEESVENNTLLYSTLSPETNNADVTEEDWTSSEMNYDTRPGLHKVVTVHPFRLFQSVELIRLNESAERSY